MGAMFPEGKIQEDKISVDVNYRLLTVFNDYKTISENILINTFLALECIYVYIHMMKIT